MTKIIREILVLPLRVLLLVTRFFPVVDQYTLVKWIWKIGREANDGCLLVNLAGRKKKIDEARKWAREVLAITRSAKVVNAIRVWEEIDGPEIGAIEDWIELAEEMECDDIYHLLLTKLTIADRSDKYDKSAIVDEILSSNFLPMEYTQIALMNKAVNYFQQREFNKAEEITNHVLSVGDDFFALKLKSVICLRRNEDKPAKKFFAKYRKLVPEMDYYLAVGMTYAEAEREEDSLEWFYKAAQAGFDHNRASQDIIRIFNSTKFADYCAARN